MNEAPTEEPETPMEEGENNFTSKLHDITMILEETEEDLFNTIEILMGNGIEKTKEEEEPTSHLQKISLIRAKAHAVRDLSHMLREELKQKEEENGI